MLRSFQDLLLAQTQESLLAGTNMECWRLNLGRPLARQVALPTVLSLWCFSQILLEFS